MPSACSEIIDDIEDLISSQDLNPRQSNRDGVTIRLRRRKERKAIKVEDTEQKERESDEVKEYPESIIPGTQSIYVKTWGCTHNTSDSEYMAGLLSSYGYNLTDDRDKADLWLLNSCTVKNPAEDHFRNEIDAGRSRGKSVVVAGCVSQGAPKTPYLKGLSIIGVQQIDRVVEVVEETLKGNSVRVLGQKKAQGRKAGGAQLSMPKVRRNPLVEIIAISTGCLNQCTYCKTKHARGELGSYPPDEIVNRAKEAFSEGVCEIWITSEDTGAYGRDIGSSLPELLWKIVDIIPDGCMMRVGMTNPPYILEHSQEMSWILSHAKVYSFIHIPVQSGSDCVLYDMKREYNRRDFEQLVDYLLLHVEGGVTIATDIICGFPTETEEDFNETMTLCDKYKFPSLFINQFYPRPGTPAARMQKVPTQQVKQRTKRLSELFSSYEPYKGLEGSVFDVLVTEEAFDTKHYVGHNKLYQQVLVAGDPELMGKQVKVRITSTNKFSMMGEVLGSKAVASNRQNSSLSLDSKFGYLSTISILFLVVAFRFFWIFFL